MGESRLNPRSGQYAGPLDDQVISSRSHVVLGPSEAWLKEMEPTLADLPPEEKAKLLANSGRQNVEVQIGLQALVVIPMRTLPQAEWPVVAVGMGVMKVPLLELLAKAKEQLKDQPALANMINVDEVPPA